MENWNLDQNQRFFGGIPDPKIFTCDLKSGVMCKCVFISLIFLLSFELFGQSDVKVSPIVYLKIENIKTTLKYMDWPNIDSLEEGDRVYLVEHLDSNNFEMVVKSKIDQSLLERTCYVIHEDSLSYYALLVDPLTMRVHTYKVYFHQPILHGKRTIYYSGGQVKAVEYFRNGVRHGAFQYYSPDGTLENRLIWEYGGQKE